MLGTIRGLKTETRARLEGIYDGQEKKGGEGRERSENGEEKGEEKRETKG